ncbi:MAG: GNAT family N-acetyltransferase [Candidatus Bathyarchaeota archaeon]|nr:GNAT family N-acetyltransferase [Candidatus Bathyarchaeota archaeon]
MVVVEKVDESNRQHVIDSLKSDVVRHVFAFHDIQYDPQHTTTYVAFENGKLTGYILIYTALEFPSVILESEKDATGKLIEHAPENRFIMHAPPELLPIIKRRFPDAKYYAENWMLVKKGQARFFKSDAVRRLRTKDDAIRLAGLPSSREDRSRSGIKKYLDLIGRMIMYGVFIDEELVAYAGSFLQLPQIWMIGRVYTHQDHRNKGYATSATSAVTEEALNNSESAALFVRSDNYSAIRVYEKIGYEKIGEKLWVDMGTGVKP